MGNLLRLVLVPAFALACGCSSNPKPEDPTQKPDESGPGDGNDPAAAASADPSADPGATPGSTVKAVGVQRTDDNSVPDDYTLMEGDCVQLGKKLGSLWRTDLRTTLSAKLNDAQRAKAEQSIEDGASKKEDDWANGCIKSLAGKTVDPKVLKCAFDSKDLKAFEKCLN
jgi:hypothetical protein